jgi:tetratricopeptide (TPR) repeat protein
LGRFGEAAHYYEMLLRITKAVEGNETVGVANIYQKLGEAFEQVERYEDSIAWFNKCIELRKKLPDQAASVASTYQLLGVLYLESMLNYKQA